MGAVVTNDDGTVKTQTFNDGTLRDPKMSQDVVSIKRTLYEELILVCWRSSTEIRSPGSSPNNDNSAHVQI